MKKSAILLLLVCGFTYLIFSSNSGGPGLTSSRDCTGVIDSNGCGGSGCHGTSSSSLIVGMDSILDVSGAPVTHYEPFGLYYITMTYSNMSSTILPWFGYQMSVSKFPTTTSAGFFLAPVGSHTVSVTGLQLVEHSSRLSPATGTGGAGTTYRVSVQWIAPPPGTGTVRVATALNAVDGSGTADSTDLWGSGSGSLLLLPEGVAPISGMPIICVGSTTVMTDLTPGGVWVSSDPSIATISSTGDVTAISPGTVTISYTASTGTATHILTVSLPPGPISGGDSLCIGSPLTLSDTTAGGTWESSDTTLLTIGLTTGVATGISAGTVTITYATSGTGCISTTTVAVRSCPLGVSPVKANGGLAVYPNPAQGKVSISVSSIWTSAHIRITDIMGREVYDHVHSTNSLIQLDLHQPAGVYFVTATSGGKTQSVRLLIE